MHECVQSLSHSILIDDRCKEMTICLLDIQPSFSVKFLVKQTISYHALLMLLHLLSLSYVSVPHWVGYSQSFVRIGANSMVITMYKSIQRD